MKKHNLFSLLKRRLRLIIGKTSQGKQIGWYYRIGSSQLNISYEIHGTAIPMQGYKDLMFQDFCSLSAEARKKLFSTLIQASGGRREVVF